MADGIIVAAQRLLEADVVKVNELGFAWTAYDKEGKVLGVMLDDGRYIVKAKTKDNTLNATEKV